MKIIYTIILLFSAFYLSGCSTKLDTVSPNKKNVYQIDYRKKHYQVYGAYNKKYKVKLQSILKKMEKKVNNNFKNTFKAIKENLSSDDIYNDCKEFLYKHATATTMVYSGKFLMDQCIHSHSHVRIYYDGGTINAKLKNSNRLDIYEKYGLGYNNFMQGTESIRLIEINNKIILINRLSGNNDGALMTYLYDNIMNFIKAEHIQNIQGDINLGFNEHGLFLNAIEN